MPSLPYVIRRRSGYSYRRRVPDDLQLVLGKREIIVSLQTHDPKEAACRMGRLHAAVNEVFQRGKMGTSIDHEQAEAIATAWKNKILNQDFEARIQTGLRQEGVPPNLQEVAGRLNQARQELAGINVLAKGVEVEQLIKDLGLQVDADSLEFNRLGFALLKANVSMLEELAKRADPAYVHPMEVLPENNSESIIHSTLTLTEALAQWEADGDPRPHTVHEWRMWIRRFTQMFGDLPIGRITKAQIREFKERCRGCPRRLSGKDKAMPFPDLLKHYRGQQDVVYLSPVTINKGLSAIHTILNLCVVNGQLEINPAAGIRIPVSKIKKGRQRRLPFSADDLKTIFEKSPVYRYHKRPNAGGREAAYWIPIIALYSGARLSEIGQLRLTDIREESGIPYMDINLDAADKTVKTHSSLRRVPLHPKLLELGLLDYAQRIQQQGHVALFPHLKPGARGVTHEFTKWFGQYLRNTCGITDTRKVFHSFRHTFKDACRDAGIPKDVHDALTGHVDSSVSASYGSGHSLKTLAEAIRCLEYLGAKIVEPNE